MDEYTALAEIYDEFMDNIEYEKMADRMEEILKREEISDGLLLDLGCGTGTITECMAAKGYDMTGIDASDEMLQQAIAKRDESGFDILYLLQDMREFELYGTMRAVISSCDCVNYITEPQELKQVFSLVNNYLDPGGLFLFDFNTKKKYASIGNSSISESRDSGAFIWENYYDEESFINEYQLTLFLPEKGDLYRKKEEYHQQRGYDLEEIKALLKEAGMIFIEAFDDYSREKAGDESERILVVAREKGK